MIYFALSANLRVEMVSSILSIIGDTAAINVVFVFPPSESYNNLVIFESLYGIWVDFLPWAKDDITLPREERERLIVLSSSRCC